MDRLKCEAWRWLFELHLSGAHRALCGDQSVEFESSVCNQSYYLCNHVLQVQVVVICADLSSRFLINSSRNLSVVKLLDKL